MTLYEPLLKRPWIVLSSMILLTIFMGLGISKIEVRNSFDGELPQTDPIVADLDKLKLAFDERSTVLIGIRHENIFNEGTLEKVVKISEALKEVPFVIPDEINSLSTLNNLKNREWGLDVGTFMKEIPQTAEALSQLRQDVNDNDLVRGKFVSEDETFTLIAANLEEGFDGGTVYEKVYELIKPYEGPEQIHLSGAPLMVEDVQRGISGDSRRFIPIALLIIFIGFYLCFGTPRGTLLPILVVIMSIIWTMGFMGYAGLNLTVVSNALPVVMVAVASSYGIHLMYTYYEKANEYHDRLEIVSATLKKVGAPILITGITSAIGSASLLIFKIISLQEFGIIGAAGFGFATIICLTVLPAILLLLPVSKGKLYKRQGLSNIIERITRFSYQNNYAVAFSAVGLLAILGFYASQIKIGDNYLKFFPSTHTGRIAAETFNEKLSGMRFMELMIDTKEPDGIKDAGFYKKLKQFQANIDSNALVGDTYAYTDVVEQVKNSMLQEEKLDLSTNEISQFFMLYEMSSDPGDVFALRDEDFQRARLQIFLKTSEPSEHEYVYQTIEKQFYKFFPDGNTELTFGGEVMYRIALGRYIVKGKIQNILLALLAVFIIVTLLFRSIIKGTQTIIPITISLITVFGLMGLFGIRLGISTSLLTAMIVGIGVDFAVHYLTRYYKELETQDNWSAIQKTATTTGTAIFFDAISNTIGFCALSFSGFVPVQHFGWLLALSMFFIFLVTIIIYPCLFAFSVKHRATYNLPIESIKQI